MFSAAIVYIVVYICLFVVYHKYRNWLIIFMCHIYIFYIYDKCVVFNVIVYECQ